MVRFPTCIFFCKPRRSRTLVLHKFQTKMISYFKVFVFTLFPPALILISLLLIPFPPRVGKAVISLCDSFLFLQPHPHIPLSLFWCVLALSAATFLVHMDNLNNINHLYRGQVDLSKTGSAYSFEDRDRLLIKLLAEERNCWICGCNMMLWIGVHRYRTLLKNFYTVQDEKATVLREKQVVMELFTQSQSDQQHEAPNKEKNSLDKKQE